MEISIRLFCYDLPGETRNIELDIADGSSVAEALEAFAEQYAVKLTLDALKDSLYLINNTVANLNSLLAAGDRLMVLRTMAGG